MNRLYLLPIFLFATFNLIAQGNPPRITLDPSLKPFYHGVESGDPESDHIIIWTRVTSDSGNTNNIDVYWQIATDTGFTNIINYGKVEATDSSHFCVKVDVCGLQPSTYYYYMFNALGANSIVGRTKTAPAVGANVDSLRFAVVSCASWEHGYFNAYQSISEKNNIDAVVHVGDYIYEYASGDYSANISGRTYDPPTAAVTELGYELRYSQYKLDDQLKRLHQLFPFITVWDDHETCDNSYSTGAPDQTAADTPYVWRKYNSTSTYLKWMPLRKPDPTDTIRIFRKLRYGKLLDLIMLDTRLYDRDKQDLSATNDSTRHMMGPVERAWFFQQLDDTATQWKIIGNQVMFAPLNILGQPVNSDQWDGYNYERTLIENHILQQPDKDVVIITGDIHSTWLNDVPGPNYNANTGAGSVCVEFVGTSVTSPAFPIPVGQNVIMSMNSHEKFVDLVHHGYFMLNVNKHSTQADYNYESTITQLGATDVEGPHFYVNDNERFLHQTTNTIVAPVIAAPNPSLTPNQQIAVRKISNKNVTVNENNQVTVNLIPSRNICPSVTISGGSSAHGFALSLDGQNVTYTPSHNYVGPDTSVFYICSVDTVPVCDTIYVFENVLAVSDIDTFIVQLKPDSSYSTCINFDYLLAPASTVTHTQPQYGQLSITDTCFTYTADSITNRIDTILFIGCDTTGRCDTVTWIFKIAPPATYIVINEIVNKNNNVVLCLDFDALHNPHSSIQTRIIPHNSTLQWINDSCVRISPYYNYTGNDTMQFIACDLMPPYLCDTITVYLQVIEPTALPTPSNLVVFGMFPNPVSDRLVVQYYLYQNEIITFNVYDISGKQVSTQSFSHVNSGLQYAEVNMTTLPNGNYIVELKGKNAFYRKKMVKE